jgi:hypothetical protein
MKELIEDYKKKVQNIENFLRGYEGSMNLKAIARTRERVNCYRRFILELEKLEKEVK